MASASYCIHFSWTETRNWWPHCDCDPRSWPNHPGSSWTFGISLHQGFLTLFTSGKSKSHILCKGFPTVCAVQSSSNMSKTVKLTACRDALNVSHCNLCRHMMESHVWGAQTDKLTSAFNRCFLNAPFVPVLVYHVTTKKTWTGKLTLFITLDNFSKIKLSIAQVVL